MLNPSGICQCGCGETAPLSTTTDPKRGYVKGEAMRFLPHHHERLRKGRDPVERFWSKVDKRGPDECWEWTGARMKTGYGAFNKGGNVIVYAHRFSHELAHGEFPGMHICHTCDNPPCVNPAHLFLGSHADNMADMKEKGRAKPGGRGEGHRSAKLSADQVRHIRRIYTGERGQQAAIARRYGVTDATVQGIIKRRTWRHI